MQHVSLAKLLAGCQFADTDFTKCVTIFNLAFCVSLTRSHRPLEFGQVQQSDIKLNFGIYFGNI